LASRRSAPRSGSDPCSIGSSGVAFGPVSSGAMPFRTYEEYRSRGALASLDEDWLQHAESEPSDLAWFVALAEGLAAEARRSAPGRCSSSTRASSRRADSGRCGSSCCGAWARSRCADPAPARGGRDLERVWAASPISPRRSSTSGSQDTDDPARLWDKVNRLHSLLHFDVGEVVVMQGRASDAWSRSTCRSRASRSTSRNAPASPSACAPLPSCCAPASRHLLRRKLEDPAGLERLRDEDPPGLLRALLETADKPMTATEIRESLTGIVPEAKWAAWWAAARRHPQVVTSTGAARPIAGRPPSRAPSTR